MRKEGHELCLWCTSTLRRQEQNLFVQRWSEFLSFCPSFQLVMIACHPSSIIAKSKDVLTSLDTALILDSPMRAT